MAPAVPQAAPAKPVKAPSTVTASAAQTSGAVEAPAKRQRVAPRAKTAPGSSDPGKKRAGRQPSGTRRQSARSPSASSPADAGPPASITRRGKSSTTKRKDTEANDTPSSVLTVVKKNKWPFWHLLDLAEEPSKADEEETAKPRDEDVISAVRSYVGELQVWQKGRGIIEEKARQSQKSASSYSGSAWFPPVKHADIDAAMEEMPVQEREGLSEVGVAECELARRTMAHLIAFAKTSQPAGSFQPLEESPFPPSKLGDKPSPSELLRFMAKWRRDNATRKKNKRRQLYENIPLPQGFWAPWLSPYERSLIEEGARVWQGDGLTLDPEAKDKAQAHHFEDAPNVFSGAMFSFEEPVEGPSGVKDEEKKEENRRATRGKKMEACGSTLSHVLAWGAASQAEWLFRGSSDASLQLADVKDESASETGPSKRQRVEKPLSAVGRSESLPWLGGLYSSLTFTAFASDDAGGWSDFLDQTSPRPLLGSPSRVATLSAASSDEATTQSASEAPNAESISLHTAEGNGAEEKSLLPAHTASSGEAGNQAAAPSSELAESVESSRGASPEADAGEAVSSVGAFPKRTGPALKGGGRPDSPSRNRGPGNLPTYSSGSNDASTATSTSAAVKATTVASPANHLTATLDPIPGTAGQGASATTSRLPSEAPALDSSDMNSSKSTTAAVDHSGSEFRPSSSSAGAANTAAEGDESGNDTPGDADVDAGKPKLSLLKARRMSRPTRKAAVTARELVDSKMRGKELQSEGSDSDNPGKERKQSKPGEKKTSVLGKVKPREVEENAERTAPSQGDSRRSLAAAGKTQRPENPSPQKRLPTPKRKSSRVAAQKEREEEENRLKEEEEEAEAEEQEAKNKEGKGELRVRTATGKNTKGSKRSSSSSSSSNRTSGSRKAGSRGTAAALGEAEPPEVTPSKPHLSRKSRSMPAEMVPEHQVRMNTYSRFLPIRVSMFGVPPQGARCTPDGIPLARLPAGATLALPSRGASTRKRSLPLAASPAQPRTMSLSKPRPAPQPSTPKQPAPASAGTQAAPRTPTPLPPLRKLFQESSFIKDTFMGTCVTLVTCQACQHVSRTESEYSCLSVDLDVRGRYSLAPEEEAQAIYDSAIASRTGVVPSANKRARRLSVSDSPSRTGPDGSTTPVSVGSSASWKGEGRGRQREGAEADEASQPSREGEESEAKGEAAKEAVAPAGQPQQTPAKPRGSRTSAGDRTRRSRRRAGRECYLFESFRLLTVSVAPVPSLTTLLNASLLLGARIVGEG